jgi:hypothetical protein
VQIAKVCLGGLGFCQELVLRDGSVVPGGGQGQGQAEPGEAKGDSVAAGGMTVQNLAM